MHDMNPLNLDLDDRRSTFAARVVGCLRSGMRLDDSVSHSAKCGWVFVNGDKERKGPSWHWPGPMEFMVDEAFVNLVMAGATFVADAEQLRKELTELVGLGFPPFVK